MYDVLLLSIEQPNEIDEKLSYGNLTIETMNHFGDIREKDGCGALELVVAN